MRAGKNGPVIPVLLTCLYLLILFLGVLSYIYGSLFKSNERVHNLNILAIDYDGDAIGKSLHLAYAHLQGPNFPTLQFRSTTDFPTMNSASEEICSHGYWGVIYTHPGATERLLSAVSGNTTAIYNPKNAITFVYSGIHYPVIDQSYIAAKLLELVVDTTQMLHNVDGQALLLATNASNPSAVSSLLQPINPSSIVLFPAQQGSRVLLNTITMVAPPLAQFFFVIAFDHISTSFSVFSDSTRGHIYLSRLFGSKLFAFICGLPLAAVIYAFRENWALVGIQFVETWLCFSFYMDISYLVMDSVIGTIIQMKFAPFFLFTWVVINVTSTIFPFELNPGFYKWGYALPAHNIWLLLMQIWSRGCNSQLHIALPVLFIWSLIGHLTSARAVWRKFALAQEPTSTREITVVDRAGVVRV